MLGLDLNQQADIEEKVFLEKEGNTWEEAGRGITQGVCVCPSVHRE